MDKAIDVAGYIVKKYKEISGEEIDPLKLQKLLYFTQRESFAVVGRKAFDGDFEGWKWGPVCCETYYAYRDGKLKYTPDSVSSELRYIIDNVIYEHGQYESWALSRTSHDEISWQNARVGLQPWEDGHQVMKLDDIRKDAEKVRPYDHMWDMYYDEFDDADEEEAVSEQREHIPDLVLN